MKNFLDCLIYSPLLDMTDMYTDMGISVDSIAELNGKIVTNKEIPS